MLLSKDHCLFGTSSSLCSDDETYISTDLITGRLSTVTVIEEASITGSVPAAVPENPAENRTVASSETVSTDGSSLFRMSVVHFVAPVCLLVFLGTLLTIYRFSSTQLESKKVSSTNTAASLAAVLNHFLLSRRLQCQPASL